MERRLKNSGGLHVMELTRQEAEGGKKLSEICFLSALLCIETYLTLACIITLTGIEVSWFLLCAGILASAAFMVALQLCEGKKWAVLMASYLMLLGTFLWKGKERIGDGFLHLENAVLELVNHYYGSNFLFLRTSFEDTDRVVTEFLLAVAQLLLFVYAGALFHNSASFAAMLLMIAAAFGGMAVGLIPQELVFSGMVICVVITFAMKMMPETLRLKGKKRWWMQSEEGERRQRSKIAAMAGGLLLLLFLIVSIFVTDSLYQEKLKKPELKSQVLKAYTDFETASFWDEVIDYLEGINLGGGNFNPAGLFQGGKRGSSNTAISGGQFSQSGKISFQNITALKVAMPDIGQSVYLKGYNGAIYSRTGWQDLSNQQLKEYRELYSMHSMHAQDMQVQFLKLFGEGAYCIDGIRYLFEEGGNFWNRYFGEGINFLYQGKMTVDYITASQKYIYGPYFWDSEGMGNLSYEQDSYILPERREDSYEFDFYAIDQAEQWLVGFAFQADLDAQGHADFESSYRKYVYSLYTQMPSGHEQLQELAHQIVGVEESVRKKIEAVQAFLSNYEYTLAPGQMPAGADFVDYFLFENKKGYCMHFASSAVLLLRALGVPARYAEGYLITSSDLKNASTTGQVLVQEIRVDGTSVFQEMDEKMVEVKDYSAHAWVEVYIDQFGWMPFEMTKGFYNGIGGNVETLPEEIRKEVELLPTATPLPTNTPTPEPDRLPTPTEAPTVPEAPMEAPTEPPAEPAVPTDPALTDAAPTKSPESSILPDSTDQDGKGGGSGEGMPEEIQDAKERKNNLERWYENLSTPIKWIFRGLFALFAILLLFLGRYWIVSAFRKKQRPGRRAQVLFSYRLMENYLKEENLRHGMEESYEDFALRVSEKSALAPKEFALFQELALRAGFSREVISPEEAEGIRQACMGMRERLLENCGRLRAVYLKFVKLF